MKKPMLFFLLAMMLMVSSCKQETSKNTAAEAPHLEKRGSVTQLIVEGIYLLIYFYPHLYLILYYDYSFL